MFYPKISIITPSYNQGQYIEETIKSVLSQNYPNLEYILIDGGSRDNSLDIIKKYSSNISYWLSEKDSGQTEAINKGLKKSTGDILAYLCSDDLYEPQILYYIADIFNNEIETDLIYGNCLFIDSNGNILRRKKSVPYDIRKLFQKNIIWQPTVFMRRRVLEKVGFLNESLQFAMDYEYWLRVSKIFTIKNVDIDIARYRWHERSKTISLENQHLNEAYNVLVFNGGGGFYSRFLHRLYWPKTSSMKKFIFKLFNNYRLFK